jgi:CTP:molybdopterin cytidylyltransferase MocA
MGSHKSMLRLPDGRTLLRAHLDALGPRCAAVAVVAGAAVSALRGELQGGGRERLVVNPRWAETGPSDSLAVGLAALPPGPALVTPVDAPPVSPGDLARLLSAPAPAALSWGGRPGHPVLLDAALRERAQRSPPPGGLRELLGGAARVEGSGPQVLLNLNTPEDWAGWLTRRQGS